MWRLPAFLLLAPAFLAAQPSADVEGEKRVFETWMHSQVAYRQLPGIAVGVVSGERLVWARGFGFAGVAGGVSMTRAT